MKRSNRLLKRLKGYWRLKRSRHITALNTGLCDSEFRLFELLIDLIDWDEAHETFGYIEATDKQISEVLGWDSTKVCRNRNLLLSKNLIGSEGRSIYKVINLQEYIAYSQEKIANKQEIRSQSSNISLGSFKDDVISEKVCDVIPKVVPTVVIPDKNSLVPCDRYLELASSGSFGAMTADDMEFIEPSSPAWELERLRILRK